MLNRFAHLAVILSVALAVTAARAEDNPTLAGFTDVSGGQYQVLAQSGETIGLEVNRFMNEMLKQYSRFFANWSLKPGARVVVFNNKDDFRTYSQGAVRFASENLAGYCLLKNDGEGNIFYELVTYEHDALWSVLAHEGFHQFLGTELGAEIPVWLNEGLAQYFETSTFKNGRFQAGVIDPLRLQNAQVLIHRGAAPLLSELLAMNRATFYANAQVTYPLSWALVYYLLNRNGETYRSSTFRRYLQDLKMNHDSVRSFRHRFGDAGPDWQRDFTRYILQLKSTAPQ